MSVESPSRPDQKELGPRSVYDMSPEERKDLYESLCKAQLNPNFEPTDEEIDARRVLNDMAERNFAGRYPTPEDKRKISEINIRVMQDNALPGDAEVIREWHQWEIHEIEDFPDLNNYPNNSSSN